ncbi:MAG TPA: SDR family oxidoreductase [Longimicrobiales bacterium]|nr:SDR family oxidoreductase [Longimicrobiales bacterium]
MDLGIAGKIAFVGASSRGLGRAAAEALAAEGADLVMCARGAESLGKAASAVRDTYGVRVVDVQADLAVPADVERALAAGRDELGNYDVLVTNIGGPPAGPFEAFSPEDWRAAVAQNLESVLNLTRGVLAPMKERGWGRIINITSIAVKEPIPNLMLSNSVRAAVTGFAKTLAGELAAHGITVNNVMPGYTRTDRIVELSEKNAALHGTTPDQELKRWSDQIPMGRVGEPPELGALVAFLASQQAGYITGASIPVDGGWLRALV